MVPWSWHPNALDLVRKLAGDGIRIWSLETAPHAQSIFLAPVHASDAPIALVIGNENAGIDPEILSVSDLILSLPMRGVKRSLNVATAFGVAAYLVVHQIGRPN